jgi:hypothetical protein
MKKRFVLAAACIMAFPLMFSLSQNKELNKPTPFAAVALAGRTIVGNWCQCGCFECICDADEQPFMCGQSASAASDDAGPPVNQPSAPDVDLASGIGLLALAFLVWLRMR